MITGAESRALFGKDRCEGALHNGRLMSKRSIELTGSSSEVEKLVGKGRRQELKAIREILDRITEQPPALGVDIKVTTVLGEGDLAQVADPVL
jgi:predicted RNA-binding protein YlqC (UPF0109 family)